MALPPNLTPIKVPPFPPEFEIPDALFESVRTALPASTGQAQKEEALFRLLRIEGTIGMRYAFQPAGIPQVPAQTLRKRRGDCDELALLFVACAQKLGWDASRFQFVRIDFYIQTGEEVRKAPHAFLMRKEDGAVFDFTFFTGEHNPRTVSRYEGFRYYIGEQIQLDPKTSLAIQSVAGVQTADAVPGFAAFYYRERAVVLGRQKKNERVIEELRKARSHDPKNAEIADLLVANLVIAAANELNGRRPREKAIQTALGRLEEAERIDPRHEDLGGVFGVAYLHAGRLHLTARRYEQAIAMYDKAVEKGGDLLLAYHDRGIAYLRWAVSVYRSDLPEALKLVQKAGASMAEADALCARTCGMASLIERNSAGIEQWKKQLERTDILVR